MHARFSPQELLNHDLPNELPEGARALAPGADAKEDANSPAVLENGEGTGTRERSAQEVADLKERSQLGRMGAMTALAIALHNFPEGLAVGVGFGGAAAGLAGQSRAKAMNLALGIGLQNFPEGLAVSMPLKRAGLSSYKAFLFGQLSGVVEPVGGVLGAALVTLVTPILPYALAFAAGAMIYVVVDQLIPESLAGPSTNKQQTLAFMGGFGLMMIMDVALG